MGAAGGVAVGAIGGALLMNALGMSSPLKKKNTKKFPFSAPGGGGEMNELLISLRRRRQPRRRRSSAPVRTPASGRTTRRDGRRELDK